jgi:hypothetical protein
VTRGEPGGCELTVEPAGALDHVVVWTFTGDGTYTSWGEDEVTWEGTLVESGDVFVEFYAYGRLTEVRSVISVSPRTGSQWSWLSGSGITYNAGGLTNPPLPWPVTRVGILCHATAGCAEGDDVPQHQWYVQPQNPVHGNGFTRSQVSSGPNKGLLELSASDLNDAIDDRVTRSGACVTAAVSHHGDHSTGHPLPTFDIWFWQSGSSAFALWTPGASTSGTPLNWAPDTIPAGLDCGTRVG